MKIIKKVLVLNSLILLAGLLAACGAKKIDVTETLTLSYSGANGYGVAELENEYDWEATAFEEAGIESIETFSDLGDAFIIESAVTYEVSPKENLSNGDEITVTATINNEKTDAYNLKLVAKKRTFTVEGLPEIKQVDLFENIDVLFQGTAPYATAKITDENTDHYVNTQYKLNKDSGLNIGDIVTVTAQYDKDELLAKGYMAESDTKEFEVMNVSKYVTELSEIPDEILGKMKKQMEDAMLAHVASKWTEKESLSGMNYIGSYLLKLKNEMYGYEPNYLYLIYKIDVENSEGALSYYTYCRFSDLIILEDGTFSVDLSSYKTPSGTRVLGISSGEVFGKGNYYYLGYEDIESMFNNCVTANIEYYEYESSVAE